MVSCQKHTVRHLKQNPKAVLIAMKHPNPIFYLYRYAILFNRRKTSKSPLAAMITEAHSAKIF